MNVIGNNSSLNDTQKLCYLKSALKNDASLFQSDQDSFESLTEALRNHYENKRALVDIHISEILSVTKIQNDNPAQLRFLIDTVGNLVIPTGCIPADEDFNHPSEIACLIGSGHFFDIFGPQRIRVSNSNFRLVESKFGFVVTGLYINEPCYFKHCFLSKGWNT
ncbi:uncharacterized protein TNCT_237891 [Trichonephila clavata]|uniref:Uncharacterized protein n=1 Tax=Trichonephila clavata TaxID=2740835 RepID=A0A8X6LHS7_TRICU|nr:uncharacterized protein TNCT_237891 [Trichonephila clavata]